jgi:hypothetical protein
MKYTPSEPLFCEDSSTSDCEVLSTPGELSGDEDTADKPSQIKSSIRRSNSSGSINSMVSESMQSNALTELSERDALDQELHEREEDEALLDFALHSALTPWAHKLSQWDKDLSLRLLGKDEVDKLVAACEKDVVSLWREHTRSNRATVDSMNDIGDDYLQSRRQENVSWRLWHKWRKQGGGSGDELDSTSFLEPSSINLASVSLGSRIFNERFESFKGQNSSEGKQCSPRARHMSFDSLQRPPIVDNRKAGMHTSDDIRNMYEPGDAQGVVRPAVARQALRRNLNLNSAAAADVKPARQDMEHIRHIMTDAPHLSSFESSDSMPNKTYPIQLEADQRSRLVDISMSFAAGVLACSVMWLLSSKR